MVVVVCWRYQPAQGLVRQQTRHLATKGDFTLPSLDLAQVETPPPGSSRVPGYCFPAKKGAIAAIAGAAPASKPLVAFSPYILTLVLASQGHMM